MCGLYKIKTYFRCQLPLSKLNTKLQLNTNTIQNTNSKIQITKYKSNTKLKPTSAASCLFPICNLESKLEEQPSKEVHLVEYCPSGVDGTVDGSMLCTVQQYTIQRSVRCISTFSLTQHNVHLSVQISVQRAVCSVQCAVCRISATVHEKCKG